MTFGSEFVPNIFWNQNYFQSTNRIFDTVYIHHAIAKYDITDFIKINRILECLSLL
jgi:hypothetical protein